MKIIHCADIHIGSALQNISAEKSKIRKREIVDTFIRMLDYAGELSVDVVVIAGDLFDFRKIARQIRKEVLQAIATHPSISFLYLTGNHDYQLVFDDGDLLMPDNLFLFDEPSWQYYHYNRVCIGGIDISQQTGYGFYEQLRFDKDKFNIAVMHGSLQKIQLERLRGKHIDYLALGDIHQPDIDAKKLDMRGIYGYSGCLEGRGYDEVGERGFVLLEINNGKLNRKFVPFAKRQYFLVEVDITGLDTHTKIDNIIQSKTRGIDKENIVKVELVGKRNADTQIERENLELKLKERFFDGKVKDNSILDMASVNFDNEISLHSEFIKLVQDSDLDGTQKDRVVEYGIKALLGEAIDL
ncbi:MAG: metallophosphoesterase [Clostridia bacterium]